MSDSSPDLGTVSRLHCDVRPTWRDRLLCRIRGHDWEPWFHASFGTHVRDHCLRCGLFRDPVVP